jgi:fumarylacetoacetase
VTAPDPTVDPALRSWVDVAEDSDFPIRNLPYGVFRRPGEPRRVGVAIGERILDLAEVTRAGLLHGLGLPEDVFERDHLNDFMACGRAVWRDTRRRVSELLTEGNDELRQAGLTETTLVHRVDAELLLPIAIGDYVDFYSSIEHASNMGRMFRPDTEPLLPNWRWLPVGYHGRAGSVAVSGTPIRRPLGQTRTEDAAPTFGPTRELDIELEMGFVLGVGNQMGEPIDMDGVREHIFGMVLVNDWSARDIQRWEYVPLGPFLGKSFATSISAWVVPRAALDRYRVAGPEQQPPPLPYLRHRELWGLDIALEVELNGETISRTSAAGLYWSVVQQLTHVASNGAVVRPGDLYASGAISGAVSGSEGSLIELTRNGDRPLTIVGEDRTFLLDGDRVVLRGKAGDVALGEVAGQVVAA